jgi:hypothetical protein
VSNKTNQIQESKIIIIRMRYTVLGILTINQSPTSILNKVPEISTAG